jgi:hypothetical protein
MPPTITAKPNPIVFWTGNPIDKWPTKITWGTGSATRAMVWISPDRGPRLPSHSTMVGTQRAAALVVRN